MRRGRLSTRIALLGVAIALITGALAGALSVGLIRTAGDGAARTTLARLADVAQTAADRPAKAPAQQRLRRALNGLRVRIATVDRAGAVTTGNRLAAASVTRVDVTALLAGREVSRSTDGVFVEGRPTAGGGVLLVERRVDATTADQRAVRRILLALLIGAGVAALLALAFATRLTRPLRRTAAAAHALAAGDRDISVPAGGPAEVADVGAAINLLAAALRTSEARQRDFLLGVSHDLRTPLTAIIGYAESLASSVIPPGDVAEVGGVLLAEAHRLERLVADLLDLARLGAQDLRLDVADVDLTELADAAAQVWAARCGATGVRFHRESDGAALPVRIDAGRVRQALDGLLENALRVTPIGESIVLASRVDGGAAYLEVRDGGPGLTADDLPVAFEQGELYRRYRGVREVGTGLGLAIVHSLVTRLGGTVTAGHAAEGGAAFAVRLPLR